MLADVNRITSEEELDNLLSDPPEALVALMRRLEGDILLLGIAGKIGISLGAMARRAIAQAGVAKRVIGVARFSEPGVREKVEAAGVETIACDLLDRTAVSRLPQAPNVIYLAGRKFGTVGQEALTWAMNTLAPGYVAEQFSRSRIVAFSTGCVYPLVTAHAACTEATVPAPVGEYAQSCLGRERIFSYYSQRHGTPICLFRLNYAAELRYGVLHDIAQAVWQGQPVDVTVGQFNVIWQGDVNAQALRALELCASPAAVLNVTGPETVSTRAVARRFAELMGKEAIFIGEEGPVAYLNDASQAIRHFGDPRVCLEQLITWTAEWVMAGGRSLGKPTHFEVNDGRFA